MAMLLTPHGPQISPEMNGTRHRNIYIFVLPHAELCTFLHMETRQGVPKHDVYEQQSPKTNSVQCSTDATRSHTFIYKQRSTCSLHDLFCGMDIPQ